MRPLRGICYKIIAVILFIAMSALIKSTSHHVPGGQAVFFRSFFALPVIVIWLLARQELRAGLYTANPMGHFYRGFAGTISMGLGFSALAYLPFPDATALSYASPLLVVIFAGMFLNEDVRLFRLSMVALGLTGVLVVLSPRLTLFDGGGESAITSLGPVLALSAAVFSALAQVFVRKLVYVEKTVTIVFWFSLTASLLSLLTLPFGWVIPTTSETALLICAGLLGGLGQIFLTSSYREADASLVAPFEYVSMLFALLIGWFFFDELPNTTMLIGAALIISAGIAIIWREHYLGIERARQRKAMTPQG